MSGEYERSTWSRSIGHGTEAREVGVSAVQEVDLTSRGTEARAVNVSAVQEVDLISRETEARSVTARAVLMQGM